MLIKTLEVGSLGTNCYVVTDEETLNCAVIDPGAESGTILNFIDDAKLKLTAILITHGHFDHIMAVDEVVRETGTPVFITDADKGELQNTLPLKDGERVSVGKLEFEVIATPGHTPGGVTFKCEDALFTGDTLFKDSCGRTDFDGGSMDVLQKSLRRLAELPGDYEVYPGHDLATTLQKERDHNFYVKSATRT
jgi:glyoxylase-like metal-dependent hydrolase (beta-lactamase superfamily II)